MGTARFRLASASPFLRVSFSASFRVGLFIGAGGFKIDRRWDGSADFRALANEFFAEALQFAHRFQHFGARALCGFGVLWSPRINRHRPVRPPDPKWSVCETANQPGPDRVKIWIDLEAQVDIDVEAGRADAVGNKTDLRRTGRDAIRNMEIRGGNCGPGSNTHRAVIERAAVGNPPAREMMHTHERIVGRSRGVISVTNRLR